MSVINLATTNLALLGFNFTSVNAWRILSKSDLNIDWMLNKHCEKVSELVIGDESLLPCTVQTCFTNVDPFLCLLTNVNRSITILCLKTEIETFRETIAQPSCGIIYSLTYVKNKRQHFIDELALNPSNALKKVTGKLKGITTLRFNLKHYVIPFAVNSKWQIKTS